jgi:hypothetical protein
MWKEIFYYNPGGAEFNLAGYYGLRAEPGIGKLSPLAPGSITVTLQSIATAQALGTFDLGISVADGVGGETPIQVYPTPITLNAGQGALIQWPSALTTTAYGYNVYIRPIGTTNWRRLVVFNNPLNSISAVNSPMGTNEFLIAQGFASMGGGSGSPIGPPGLENTTQAVNFLTIPVSGQGWQYAPMPLPPNLPFGIAYLIHTFPADPLINSGGAAGPRPITPISLKQPPGGGRGPGGGGGGHPVGGGGRAASSISGGAFNLVSPIPQIIQFANLMFLALGNGITPFVSNGQANTATHPNNTVAITNTFQASFPTWQANIGYLVGDQIAFTIPSSPSSPPILFTAVQGGISGPIGSEPAFQNVTNIDQTIADNQIIWKNSGTVPTPNPPAGASHVEVYAGSLWVANTAPSFDAAFPSDGPSGVWMSDANNPNSWNPLNTAQIARDDGTEITGLKAFSVAEAGIPTTQQLVVFKNFSTYIINGVFGAADFSIQQAETDQGCIAPRTIQFVPGFGLLRLTHLGFSFFDGIRDRLISTDIRPYLFGDPGQPDIMPMDWAFSYFSKGAQVADPPMYVAAIPVLGANADLLATLPASQFTITATAQPGAPIPPNFPPGNYFFRITLRGPIHETAITPEIGPIPVPPDSSNNPSTILIQSSSPLPAGYLGWRVYWSELGPNREDRYQDFNLELGTPGAGAQLVYPGTATTGYPRGLSGSLTRIVCYDLTLKCWTIVDLPFSISVLKSIRVLGQLPLVISGGFYDNTVRYLFHNAPDWDGTPINWSLQTGEVYNQGGDQRVFYRRLRVRGQGTGPIYILPNYEGNDEPDPPTLLTGDLVALNRGLAAVFWALGGDQFMAEGGMMSEAVNAHATVSGQGRVVIDSLDFHAVPKPIGAGAVIS